MRVRMPFCSRNVPFGVTADELPYNGAFHSCRAPHALPGPADPNAVRGNGIAVTGTWPLRARETAGPECEAAVTRVFVGGVRAHAEGPDLRRDRALVECARVRQTVTPKSFAMPARPDA